MIVPVGTVGVRYTTINTIVTMHYRALVLAFALTSALETPVRHAQFTLAWTTQYSLTDARCSASIAAAREATARRPSKAHRASAAVCLMGKHSAAPELLIAVQVQVTPSATTVVGRRTDASLACLLGTYAVRFPGTMLTIPLSGCA